jgi:hypothetical protein
MSVDPKRQKAEKYRGWLTPPQAIKALSSIYRIDSARSDIFARLQAGLIVAYAAKVYAPDDEDDITHVEIQAAVWRGVDLHDLARIIQRRLADVVQVTDLA